MTEKQADLRQNDSFSGARAIAAEGARVGLVTCLTCGAAVLIDPTDEQDRMAQHEQWHLDSRPDPRTAFIGG